MRYLKKFFESSEISKEFSPLEMENILETCKNYLAYLLDNSEFSVGIEYESYVGSFNHNILDIDIISNVEDNYEKYHNGSYCLKWSDIKDNIIPLISLLRNGHHFTYNLLQVKFYLHDGEDVVYLADDEIDKLINDEPISKETYNIKGYETNILDHLDQGGIVIVTLKISK